MLPSRRWTDDPLGRGRSRGGEDTGSAALEFILAGLVLLVPLVYLIVTLGVIQGRTLGVETAARQVARAVSLAPDVDAARARADEVLRAITEEYDVDADDIDITLACHPAGGSCPRPGVTVEVTVQSRVALPLVPPVLGLDRASRIGVEATAVQKLSRMWGGE